MSEAPSISVAMEAELVSLIPALRAFSYRFVCCGTDADDLVQEVVSRALAHLGDFEEGTRMKSWLFTIMRHTYCSAYKRSVREACGPLADAATYEVPVSARQDWAMRAVDVDAALLRLPAGERKALLLVANGISYIDAASSCGCKIGTIKSRVSRARLHLMEILGETSLGMAVSVT